MRITERRLRQIVREELSSVIINEEDVTAAPAPVVATDSGTQSVEDPAARSTRLGDASNRRLDIERLLKAKIKKGFEIDGLPPKGTTITVDYKIREKGDKTEVGDKQIVVPITADGRLMLELNFEISDGLNNELKALISGFVRALFAGQEPTDNQIRLTTSRAPGRITVDIPAGKPAGPAELEYIVKQGDELGKIVERFYGLSYSASLIPLYRLLSNNYTSPRRPNHDEIEIGDKIRLPPELKFSSGKIVKRKEGVV